MPEDHIEPTAKSTSMTRAPPTEYPTEAINMKRLSSIAISLAALALGVSSNSANAVPDKVQYELQERCAKRAEQIFAKDWPHGSPDNSVGYTQRASYISHYNASLNK